MVYSKYSNTSSYSYVFGAFGTIELLTNKPSECLSVLIDPSFIKNEAFSKIKTLCQKHNIEIIIDEKIVSKIRDKGNIFVIGVFNKYKSNLSNNKHIVLYNINNVGEIGTIIRSMRGFSFENLVLINCDVDIYDEHLIRSTMGAFFQTNILTLNNIEEYTSLFTNQKMFNISNSGSSLSNIINDDNISLIFSLNPLSNEKITNVEFKENIPLENIVNIVLFNLFEN